MWKEINNLSGRLTKQSNKGLELHINNQLVKKPGTLAAELNSFLINSVQEISSLFTAHDCVYHPVNCEQPVLA